MHESFLVKTNASSWLVQRMIIIEKFDEKYQIFILQFRETKFILKMLKNDNLHQKKFVE